jgi:hypothetical protein
VHASAERPRLRPGDFTADGRSADPSYSRTSESKSPAIRKGTTADHRDVNLQITLAGLIMVFEDGNFVELTSKTNSGAFSPSLPIREPLLKFVEINVVNRGNV